MRLACAAVLLAGVAGIAGCTSPGGEPDVLSANGPSAAAGAPTVGAKAQVCATVRAAVADHMGPMGTALGRYVGFRTAADTDDLKPAGAAVKAQIDAVAAAISSAGATALDPALRTAAASAAAGLSALGGDATFLAGVTEMSDVPTALARVSTAVQPLTDACS